VVTATVSLPAFSQTINIPASFTEDNVARDVTFSYPDAMLAVGSGTISATLQAVGGTLNAKKLDLQTGIGNDALGWLLAQFTVTTNSSGGTAIFQVRNIAAIPDRNYADAAHRMLYYPVLGLDGKTWLNNNLGADYANTTNASFNPAEQAISSSDTKAYGSYFQWGRNADGHELRSSARTTTLSSSDQPGNGSFIYNTNTTTFRDWRSPQNPNLWQGVAGVNNPCPSGYRLPTIEEWGAESLKWTVNNAAGAWASPLKLPLPGIRDTNDRFYFVGVYGYYWSSGVSTTYYSKYFSLSGTLNRTTSTSSRAAGDSVRCIKDY
jgi:uncharacterized protein (TIGR02145 family)